MAILTARNPQRVLSVALVSLSLAHAQSQITLTITNNCSDTIWPALNTQGGAELSLNGFELASKASRNLTAASKWDGRIWGRTNCTFDNSGSGSCMTGDCGKLDCTGIVSPPVRMHDFGTSLLNQGL